MPLFTLLAHLAQACPMAHTQDQSHPCLPGYMVHRVEEGMATHSSILTWSIPWTEEPAGYSPWGYKVGHNCTHLTR